MTTLPFTSLGKTAAGRTSQINRTFKGMAQEMKRRQSGLPADCNDLGSLSQQQLISLVVSLEQQLDEALALIEDHRTAENSDVPVVVAKSWTTRQVVERSGVCVSTITRNALSLGGTQLASGDWVFPVGTTYGRRRKAK